MKYSLTITTGNPIVKGHMIYEENLLPGLAYIDVLYQLIQKGMNLDYRKHCLTRLSIHNPLIVREDHPVKLEIQFDRVSDYWKITVRNARTYELGSPLPEKLYITAELHEKTILFEEQVDIEAVKQAAAKSVDMETVYAAARKRGLVHQGMIKARGNFYPTDFGCLIEVNVDDTYHDEGQKVLFHPALIDGAGMATGFLAGNDDTENNEDLYIPLYYESFSAVEPLQTHCYAMVKSSSTRFVNDVRTANIAFFNKEGKQVAQLNGVTAKQIRFKEQMNPDLRKETPSRERAQSAVQGHSALEVASQYQLETTASHIESRLRQIFSRYLNRPASQIDINSGFSDIGLQSSQLMTIVNDIENAFSLTLSSILLFENNNIRELIDYIKEKKKESGYADLSKSEHEALHAFTRAESVPFEEGVIIRAKEKEQKNLDLRKEILSRECTQPAVHRGSVSDMPTQYQLETASTYIESLLRKIFSRYLNRPATQIDINSDFYDFGLESSQLMTIVQDIENSFSLSLSPTLLFEHNNIRELIDYVKVRKQENNSPYEPAAKPENESVSPEEEVVSKSHVYEFYEHEPFLKDHLIYGQPALMGVAHVSLAVEAYIQNNPRAYPVEIRNIKFTGGPVTLKKGESAHVLVQFEDDGNQKSFKTVFYLKDPNHTKPCCQGENIGSVMAFPKTIDIEAILDQSKPLDRNTIDQSYKVINNFTIGPMLQTIDSAFVYGESTVISKVCLSGKLKKGNVSRFIFDPLLLNSCYLLSNFGKNEKRDNIFIPLMMERLTIYRPMTETAYIVKTLRYKKTDFISFDAVVLTEQGDIIAELVNASVKEVLNPSQLSNASFSANPAQSLVKTVKSPENDSHAMDIAIIGLNGRYPRARNIQEFWENLKEGRDCITEVPKERWDHSLYFDEDKSKPGKTYCKWGGFLEDIDLFDPLFFNSSPREAEITDPMLRLFLETVWNLFENIGYTREILQRQYQSRVGVYVGAMYQQYHYFNTDLITESAISVSSYSSIANRVSYFFNLNGPSVAVDTACSSSAMAIHMACESLKNGECQLAIAGGVNLSIHPNKYLGLSMMQILGSHPTSRSFANGDGFLPAEGVGAVLLKPLPQAIRDGDSILAVIKSTATNHGGRTNAYFVPNPNAQAQLFEDNFKKSGIDPRTVSYVEAAANGTVLGDPVEINALNKAFKKFTTDRQFCAIGSVKSNIGHAEAASGISQLTKVILQLQHRQLVPTIKTEPLNPNISFDNTPFYLQRGLQEWHRPVVMIGGEEREFPRRATVSSFGAGGSNVHLIIEEYVSFQEASLQEASLHEAQPPIPFSSSSPEIVVFSAKSQDQLVTVVQQMIDFMEHQEDLSLPDIAYTLQTGREAMESRLAMIVANKEELLQGMKGYLNKKAEVFIPSFTGELDGDYSKITGLLSGKVEQAVLQVILAEKDFEKIALYWTQGGKIPWELLHEGRKVRKIPLPTYPFARERYWVTEQGGEDHRRTSIQHAIDREQKATDVGKPTQENIQSYIVQFLSGQLHLSPDRIKVNKNLQDYSVDSIIVMKLIRDFETRFKIKMTGREMLEHQTIHAMAAYLALKLEAPNNHLDNTEDNVVQTISQPMRELSVEEREIGALEKFRAGELTLEEIESLIDIEFQTEFQPMHAHARELSPEEREIEALEKFRAGELTLEEIESLLEKGVI